jgi:hypothetical protein
MITRRPVLGGPGRPRGGKRVAGTAGRCVSSAHAPDIGQRGHVTPQPRQGRRGDGHRQAAGRRPGHGHRAPARGHRGGRSGRGPGRRQEAPWRPRPGCIRLCPGRPGHVAGRAGGAAGQRGIRREPDHRGPGRERRADRGALAHRSRGSRGGVRSEDSLPYVPGLDGAGPLDQAVHAGGAAGGVPAGDSGGADPRRGPGRGRVPARPRGERRAGVPRADPRAEAAAPAAGGRGAAEEDQGTGPATDRFTSRAPSESS